MEFQNIILKKEERIATIILNRPEVFNALNQQMADELVQAIKNVSQDEETRVLILTGAGRGFCSGADVKIREVGGQKVIDEKEALPGFHQDLSQGKLPPEFQRHIILALQNLDKPTIAMVNGAAVGGGFEFALACDIRIGSPKARFMVALTRLASPPDSGGTWLMPRIMGLGKALEYIYTGDFCDAEEAYRIGLLNKLVPAEQLEQETMTFARKLASGSPIGHRLSKLLVYKGLEIDLETALAFAISCVSIALSSEDHKEGIRAFAEKRPPEFKGR